ncbi:MAG: RidA family protein [Bacillota bacterium]|nr:RidA family protein [Bacillota bacterium]
MEKLHEINTEKAPKAIGPYSQGIVCGDFLFTAGQIPVDPKTGLLAEGGIEGQAKQVFENLKAILENAGSDFSSVVKTTVFLQSLNDFAKVNDIYASYFKKPYPARSCIEISALPKGSLIEIEVIASVKK